MTRWLMIGKERFERELDIVRVLKRLRRTKIFQARKLSKEQRAELMLEPLNLIEVDTEDIIANDFGDDYNGLEMFNLNSQDDANFRPSNDSAL